MLVILSGNLDNFLINQNLDIGFLTFLSDWRSILLNQQTILKIFIFDVILSILVRHVTLLKVTNFNV
ncbi:hypothetical protein C3K52_18545 [Citrobacter freundii]|nr:hypothetical protein CUC46_00190 [Citrobacter freundii]AYY50279.1 hypothetical protein EGX89_17635 [Citrobacter freundii]KEL79115.1 hypothetical protein AB07_3138 [Citrobacter freundii]PSM60916.1 hypothetical protein C3K52_18545 [Citrobacter freundii]QAT71985.1 hypothetical protein EQ249_21150 [Citrobacter freundii]